MKSVYPFTALVGQEAMKLALVLNAVNPRLGGVLIRGQKGTAKSTAARGLAALLPPVEVVENCRFGCDPRAGEPRCPECEARGNPTEALERPAAFVELPLGATEDRVLGTLDIERALADGQRHFEPGLLARANRGLLYIDEVNLLPDHLVDTLLDAAAMGTHTLEREGVSFSHPAAFVLVGTMNPEEGELRPQLLDRFALAVDVEGMPSTAERAEVVRRRVAFEADAAAFAVRWQDAECAEQARIRAARMLLPRVRLDDQLLELIARICTAFDVDGLRADIVIYKTATTLAAYAGREEATPADVRRAAELALPHRRRRQPFDQPGLDRQRLEDIVREHSFPPGPPSPSSPPDEPPQTGADPDDHEPPPRDPPDGQHPDGQHPGGAHADSAEQVFEVEAVSPPPPPPGSGVAPRGETLQRSSRRARTVVESPRGRHVRSTPRRTSSLDVLATLCVAALHQPQRPRADERPQRIRLDTADLRFKVRTRPVGAVTVFVVDASGSMAARRRMALAKGAVLSLLQRAYQTRDEVALIAFRGQAADVLLPPTSSVHLASDRLRALPTGGRTPLALALHRARALLAHAATTPERAAIPTLVLVSDGRANVALAGGDPYADALAEARLLRMAGVGAVVVDTEEGPLRLGRAHTLAVELGAAYVMLADLSARAQPEGALAATVRNQPWRVRL
jgi:magnesium chelatase subunit D